MISMTSLNVRTAMAAAIALPAVFAIVSPSPAMAATSAMTVTGVNLRAGPSTGYPVVISMPPRAGLTLFGCTADTSWCDVSWGRERGWVASRYVQVSYHGSPVVVTPAIVPAIGLTVVAFSRSYWNSYYVGRPWYGQWDSYYGPGPGRPPTRPPAGAVAGCNDNGCAGAIGQPGRAAVGHCADGTCSGTSVNRGPLGNVRIRHGSISRD